MISIQRLTLHGLATAAFLCHITNSIVLLRTGGSLLPFGLIAVFESLLNIMPLLDFPLLIETKALSKSNPVKAGPF
jgi:hypothetical protein